MNKKSYFFKVSSLICLLILANLVTGCGCLRLKSSLVEFHIYNQTNQVIYVYIDMETFLDDVEPGEKTVWESVGWLSEYEFIAKDEEGLVLYSLLYRSTEIKGKKIIDVYFPPEDEKYDVTPTKYKFFYD